MKYSIILLATLVICCARQISSQNPTADAYKQLKTILSNDYEKEVAPRSFSSNATEVDITLHIIRCQMNSNEKKLETDMYFRQLWNDPRLVRESEVDVIGGQPLVDNIWTPDTFFSSSSSVRTMKYPKPNVFIRVKPNGDILFSQRLQQTTPCAKKDETAIECTISFESYGFSASDIVYGLKRGQDSMSLSKNLGNPDSQLILANNTIEEKVEHLSMGDYSGIEIKLTFVEKGVTQTAEVTQEPVKAKDLISEGKKLGKMFSKFQFPS